MKQYTQSNTDPGNCWQTAVACILEVDPAELPDQVALEGAGKQYTNRLNAYLGQHHGLMYSELEDYQWLGIMPREPGWHLIIGPTIRTTETHRIHHVVVGRFGEEFWDPHPSRAGLTEPRRWGILAALPNRIRDWRKEMLAKGGEWEFDCVCPACVRP